MVATELLKLAMDTTKKEKKMVATTQLRLSPETEDKEELDWNICQITQSIYYIPDINCSILRGVIINKVD